MYLAQETGFGSAAAFAPPRRAMSAQAAPPRRAALAVDLAEDMGSARWWRGLATLVALLAFAWQFSPGLRPLPGRVAAPVAVDANSRIGTLAGGSRTGRRLVASDAVQPLTDAPERASIELSATTAAGESLATTLVRAGVGAREAARAAALAAGAAGSDRLPAGTALALTLGQRANRYEPRPLEALRFRARFDLKLAVLRVAGILVARPVPITVDSRVMRISGSVADGIFMSATGAGAPVEAVQTFLRALAARTPIDALEATGRYDLVIERQRTSTGETRFGKLLYAGLEQSTGTLRMIEWTIGGRTGWYDEGGVGAQRAGGLMAPVSGHVTSGFGLRFHPLLHYSRMHQGIDYGAYYGSPIRATADGTVVFAGWHGGHGNMVKLSHGGGMGSGYAHMSRMAVAAGDRVAQGQVIGYVGSTGLSTGPHLHFEIYRNGIPVDPASASFASAPLLSGTELAAFKARVAELAAPR